MSSRKNKSGAAYGLIAAFIGLFILAVFIKIPYRIYEYPQTENLVPYEEITTANPLQNCFFLPYLYNDTLYVDNLELLFGTYNRVNSTTYTLQIFDSEKEIFTQNFAAADLKDNQFYSFNLKNSKFLTGKFCFKISTNNGKLGNAVTVWQNSDGNPILRISQNLGLLGTVFSRPIGNYFMFGDLINLVVFLAYFSSLAVLIWTFEVQLN